MYAEVGRIEAAWHTWLRLMPWSWLVSSIARRCVFWRRVAASPLSIDRMIPCVRSRFRKFGVQERGWRFRIYMYGWIDR
jgi:hypothetical protein